MQESSSTVYTDRFYEVDLAGSFRSAQRIVPLLRSLIDPRSVLDVGCGNGAFLKAFSLAGVADILGVDGDYVPRERLLIDMANFRPTDLAKPLALGRRFDLVMSLEVAEHLPAAAAPSFVRSLVEHGDVVFFSAAVPGQRGANHVNEQWPSYWAKLFAAHGMRPYDVIRPRIWQDREIEWWYRQNCLIFARTERAAGIAELNRSESKLPVLDVVHPALFAGIERMASAAGAELATIKSQLAAGTRFAVAKLPNGTITLTRIE